MDSLESADNSLTQYWQGRKDSDEAATDADQTRRRASASGREGSASVTEEDSGAEYPPQRHASGREGSVTEDDSGAE
jgi:hypothetical protein